MKVTVHLIWVSLCTLVALAGTQNAQTVPDAESRREAERLGLPPEALQVFVERVIGEPIYHDNALTISIHRGEDNRAAVMKLDEVPNGARIAWHRDAAVGKPVMTYAVFSEDRITVNIDYDGDGRIDRMLFVRRHGAPGSAQLIRIGESYQAADPVPGHRDVVTTVDGARRMTVDYRTGDWTEAPKE